MNKSHLLGAVCIWAISFSASANMVTPGGVLDSSDYSTLSTAWDPGVNTVRLASGNPAPGGATWSIMDAGLSDLGYDSHGTNLTTSMLALPGLAGVSIEDIESTIDKALDLWASVSGFTNLGMVTDSGVDIGDTAANGGNVGDIRVGAIYIDGNVGGDVLAHAFNPCNDPLCGTGGSIGGDTHFDDSNSWFISDLNGSVFGTGTIDLLTVMIHEFGHALGLGHSAVVGSIMEPVYADVRTALHADDIAGIQAIYGNSTVVVVPVPAAVWLFGSGLLGLIGVARRQIN